MYLFLRGSQNGEGGIQGDLDACQSAGYGAAGLCVFGDAAEVLFREAGNLCRHGEVASGDTGTRDESYISLGVDLFRGESLSGQGVAESHGEASGVGCGDEFFRAGLAAGLLGACLPGDIEGAQA
jgi:hypothetical protein